MSPFYLLSAALILTCAASFGLLLAWTRTKQALTQLQLDMARLDADLAHEKGQHEQVSTQLETLTTRLGDKEQALEAAREAETRAETRLSEANERIEALCAERDQARQQREHAHDAQVEAERELAVIRQQKADFDQRLKDFETLKEQTLINAKASVTELGHTISTKLLEDHKREAEASRKEQETRAKQAAEQFNKGFQNIMERVATLDKDVSVTSEQMATVWKALTVPAEGGRFAEVGLENSFKAFGLEQGRDYIMQYAISDDGEGNRLRPDAVIFLPNHRVMVVDSKASKFLLDVAAAEGTEDEAATLEQLKKSMREHLRLLSGKDYKSAILDVFRKAGKGDKIRQVFNVMYLPNEAALERVRRADLGFEDRAQQLDIIPCGPSGIAGLISLCKHDIGMARQSEHQEKIVEGVEGLLESLAVMLERAGKAGKSLKSASDHFNDMATSVNTRLLPRARKLEKMGVSPARNKQLPHSISNYLMQEQGTVIDAEMEKTAPKELEKKEEVA